MLTRTAVTFRNINNLAIPATISGIAEPVLSITDTAIVGNIPVDGLESLAAAGIVGSFLSMLIWVLGQTRSAISAIISQYLGAKRIKEVENLPAQAIFFNILLSFVILGSTIFIVEDIFKLFEASGKILDYCISYYSIRVWGFPLTLFTFAVFGIFRGLQNTFYPMVIALIGAGLNIVLDFILVYGIEDVIPAMYLEGAAWASLISQAVMAILVFFLLKSKTNISLKLRFPLNHELKRLIFMSLNLFVRALALNVALIVAVREATALGDRYIGAHTIAINLWLFAAFFIDGYGAAGNSMGGRLLGAKDYKGLWKLAKKIIVYGLMVSLVLMLIGFVFYYPLGRIFSNETIVLNTFYSIFFIVILGLPMNTLAFVFDGLFKGLGEMKYLRNVLLTATFLGFLPTLYIGKALGWGFYAIWIAFVVWMAIRGFALVFKFRRKFRPLLQKT
ncbi:MATE family efflux transporter [Allomuricauda sp. SCSIO 65647]|uniref:MATE family efflux transporter n=1 Tax=Allomuricauda sp. SCSIO 65647 TaxID=2908843 RepID=UPI001F366C4C|nr:MATE family efflux transporter [Muricauda sp. SCSIO 65647]UJH69207.1 MATE family efflux transporter [Muricauda sp. SCSIO 65647]